MADLLWRWQQMRLGIIQMRGAIDKRRSVAREKVLAAANTPAGYVGGLVPRESIQMHGGIV
ncbi:hypothetical protein [Comamonas terrigena]|uniref:hypothetical protein n=1 Tax=Comamonas terrigena TaxID=32013 RepID=UPI000FD6577A|nr:hypothetical protein [Comamonas terrigena]